MAMEERESTREDQRGTWSVREAIEEPPTATGDVSIRKQTLGQTIIERYTRATLTVHPSCFCILALPMLDVGDGSHQHSPDFKRAIIFMVIKHISVTHASMHGISYGYHFVL